MRCNKPHLPQRRRSVKYGSRVFTTNHTTDTKFGKIGIEFVALLSWSSCLRGELSELGTLAEDHPVSVVSIDSLRCFTLSCGFN